MTVRLLFLSCLLMIMTGCAAPRTVNKNMNVTAYCDCGKCCSWERGSWKYLKLDFWNRYVSAGRSKGRKYSGLTASGTKPTEPVPGLMSLDSLKHPWMIPFRVVFPWLWFQQDGTIAADTKYYPFGTRMYVEGYGWGVVADRGGGVKGSTRLDLYHDSHRDALVWGRKKMKVTIEK